jgi:aminoglycoside 3-N-acetyltransferase
VTYDELDGSNDDFAPIGEAFAATGGERVGPVGAGIGRLCKAREVVDFAVGWMEAHRT